MRKAPQCLLLAICLILVSSGCQSEHQASRSVYGILYVLTANNDAKKASLVSRQPTVIFNWVKFDEETSKIIVDDCPRDFRDAWDAYRQKVSQMAQMHPDYITSASEPPDPSVMQAWQSVTDSARRHGIIFAH